MRPDASRPVEEEAFRFHHVLIRDTAYEAVLKRARATLHERFVQWADRVNREGAVEYEEILGYHLEQAHRYLSELGPLDERGLALGADAARRLASAGQRAFARGDVPAAANLYGRAAAVLPEDAPARLELLPEYGEALLQTGRYDEAVATLEDAIRLGEQTGAADVAAHASLVRLLVRLRAGEPESWRAEAGETIVAAMAVFEAAGDNAGLAKAWRLLAWTHGTACRFENAAEASERALEHARKAGDARQAARAATGYAAAAVLGPTPIAQAIEQCERAEQDVSGDRQSEAILLALLGSLHGMQGSTESGRALAARSREMLEELGLFAEVARVRQEAWRVEMLANDLVAAEREIRTAYDLLSQIGEKYLLSTVAGLLAQTLYALGRLDEVDAPTTLSRELATDDDVDTQALWRCVSGKMSAQRGDVDAGEGLIREAIEILAPTDGVLFQYGALIDLAEVQRLAGRPDEQAATLRQARSLAEAKGSEVMAGAAELPPHPLETQSPAAS